MREYHFDKANHLRGASANQVSRSGAVTKDGEAGIHNPRTHGYAAAHYGYATAHFTSLQDGHPRPRHA